MRFGHLNGGKNAGFRIRLIKVELILASIAFLECNLYEAALGLF